MAFTANRDGIVQGRFRVPQNIPTGTVRVIVEGDQGSRGETTYTASGTIQTDTLRTVTNLYYNYDPLAQTFSLAEGRHVAGVDLFFKVRGTSRVNVQIRETTAGFPNKTVIAQASVNPSNINLNGAATRITFRPIWLEPNVEYALVVLTDDAQTALSVAELGKYDSRRGTYVTQQPYQAGVLLSSSNASTWTAHQDMDLSFRLLACRFTENACDINLGTVAANNNTEILIKGNIERVSAETDAEFTLTDTSGRTNTLAEDMPVSLREVINGNQQLKVRLRGNAKQSPVLYQGIQLVLGTQAQTADYVTRAIPAGTNSTVRIVYDSYTPGNSNVKIYYQQPDLSWTLIPLTKGAPLGDGLEERTHILTSFNQVTVKIKIVLEGNVLYRPKVKNLRITTI